MKYICDFTGGIYFNEACLIKLLKVEMNIENTMNIVNLNMNKTTRVIDSTDNNFQFEDKGSFSYQIFCKQPLRDRKLADFISINNEMLRQNFSNTAIDEVGLNLFAFEGKL